MAKIKQSAVHVVARAIAASVHNSDLPLEDHAVFSYRDLALKFIAAWEAAGKLKTGEIFEPPTPAELAAEKKAAEQAAAEQKQDAADAKQEAADAKQEAADQKAADKLAAKAGR